MTYSKLLSLCTAAAIASGGSFLIAPAVAADKPITVVATPTDLPTRSVRFADLNLASLKDQKRLHFRVDNAVRRVCEDSLGGSEDVFVGFACHRESWNGAKPQIALAIQRAQDIAATGSSPIAASAITIVAAR